MSGSAPDRQRHEEIRFETSDVRARPILLGTAGIGALALASFLAMWGLFHALADREARESAQPNPLAERYGRRQPPEPRLQTHPRDDLLALQRSGVSSVKTSKLIVEFWMPAIQLDGFFKKRFRHHCKKLRRVGGPVGINRGGPVMRNSINQLLIFMCYKVNVQCLLIINQLVDSN